MEAPCSRSGPRADPVAGKGEDEEPAPVADAAPPGAKIGAERWQTIRPRRHEIVGSVARDARTEASHDVTPLVFERNGGMAMLTSVVSKATSASTSRDSHER